MNDLVSSSVALAPAVLAQIPVASESQIMSVLLGGAALMVVVNQVLTIASRLKTKPEPREVQAEAREQAFGISERVACLGGRVERVDAAHNTLVARVDHHEGELVTMRDRETNCAGRIHKRIDEIATIQAHTAGKVDEGFAHLKQSLSEIRLIVLSGKASQ